MLFFFESIAWLFTENDPCVSRILLSLTDGSSGHHDSKSF